jgi:hypothetical protein
MRNKRPVPNIKPNIAVVVDGETETWYLQMLKKHEKERLRVNIRPEIPQKKKLSEQFEQVLSLANNHQWVFWVVDLDTLVAENKLAELKQRQAQIDKRHPNVTLVINHPCLEFWFFLHFEFRQPMLARCDEAGDLLRKHLQNYEKTRTFYVKEDQDIYQRLRPHLPAALVNARKQESLGLELSNPSQKGFSDLGKFFEFIKILSD